MIVSRFGGLPKFLLLGSKGIGLSNFTFGTVSPPPRAKKKRTAPKRPSSIRDVFIDHRIDLAAKLLKALILFSESVFNLFPRSQGSLLGKFQDANQHSSPYREPIRRKHRAPSRCMPIQILFILDEQTDLRHRSSPSKRNIIGSHIQRCLRLA